MSLSRGEDALAEARASFMAAIKNDADGFAPRLEKPVAKGRREFLIDLAFCNKLTQDMPSGALVENHH